MQLSNTFETILPNNFVQASFGNRIEALRAVIMLLLREVESIEEAIAFDIRAPAEADYCLPEKLERLEVDMIRCALIKTNGRQKQAAKMLGLKLTTLNAKIKKYEIDWRMPVVETDLVG